jgi:hypothetical protein
MNWRASIFCSAVLTVAFGVALAGDSDATWQKKLVGTWGETGPRSRGCELHRRVIVLANNGTFDAQTSVRGCAERSYHWQGKWKVVGGMFQYSASASSSTTDVPTDVLMQEQILTITDAEWASIPQDTGIRSVSRRGRTP